MKSYYIITFLLFYSTSFFAQVSKKSEIKSDYQQVAFSVSYFGENMFHPGFKLGVAYPFKVKEMIKVKADESVIRRGLAYLVGANLGMYRHKKNHTGLFLNAEIGGRFLTRKAKKIELLFGLGYLHTILDGETFTIGENGEIISKGVSGQGGLMPSIGVGWGKDYYWKNKSPWAWHVKGQYFLQVPYNNGFLLRTAIELGLSYRIG